ncbi:MAG: complex I NDUFA9 subunit family protein, partial [Gammaproteobacteria bacterium]
AIAHSLNDRQCIGKSFELCGPKIYQFRELVEYTARLCGIKKRMTETSKGSAMFLAAILERLPGKILTRDQLKTLTQDCLCEYDFPKIFGVEPKTVESIVPTYLAQSQKPTYLDHLRARAGR